MLIHNRNIFDELQRDARKWHEEALQSPNKKKLLPVQNARNDLIEFFKLDQTEVDRLKRIDEKVYQAQRKKQQIFKNTRKELFDSIKARNKKNSKYCKKYQRNTLLEQKRKQEEKQVISYLVEENRTSKMKTREVKTLQRIEKVDSIHEKLKMEKLLVKEKVKKYNAERNRFKKSKELP